MLRFKQFSGSGVELENAVNAWLTEIEPDVTQMTQSEGREGTLLISFIFEESFRGQELRLSSERGMSRSNQPVVLDETEQDEPIHVQEAGSTTADSNQPS